MMEKKEEKTNAYMKDSSKKREKKKHFNNNNHKQKPVNTIYMRHEVHERCNFHAVCMRNAKLLLNVITSLLPSAFHFTFSL